MSKSGKIPDDLVAQVQFLSDRTCCICRIPNRGIQVHHIDGNESNNDIDNLAVLCLECHCKTQIKGGFVRRLTPDVVKLYNKSWRDIVENKLLPSGDPNTLGEYKREVYLEISLTCHSWKNNYIILYPGNFIGKDDTEYLDIWEKMEKKGEHMYSESEWKKYLPLFREAINGLIIKFQRIIMMYSDVITPEFKTLLIRSIRQLETDQYFYLSFPEMLNIFEDKDRAFNIRFSEVINNLSYLAHKADEMSERNKI